jgi:hypothetical protein
MEQRGAEPFEETSRNIAMTRLIHLARRAASVALAGALLITAAPVAAAPPTFYSDHRVDLAADFESERVFASLRVQHSTASGPGADVTLWVPRDRYYSGEPATIISGGADLVAGPNDSTLTGTVELFVSATGEPAGLAIVDAVLTPDGPAVVGESADIGTNHKLRVTETTQPMRASGTITLPDGLGVIDLAVYGDATVTDIEAFSNAPASTVDSLDFVGMFAVWAIDGNLVMIVGNHDRDLTYVDAAVVMADGTMLSGVQDGALFGAHHIEADVPLVSGAPGFGASSGTLSVRAAVSRGERTRDVVEEGGTRTQVTIQHLVANGAVVVTLDDGTVLTLDFADASGVFYDWSERLIDGGSAR